MGHGTLPQYKLALLAIFANLCALPLVACFSQFADLAQPSGASALPVGYLPTDQEAKITFPRPLPVLDPQVETEPDWKKLARPRVNFSATWEPESAGVDLSDFDLRVTVPTYPFWGPPPPMITAGYSLTLLHTPRAMDVPDNFHDMSLGAAWIRRVNERWLTRWTLTAAFASDLENTSSDAWQLRGGGFALFQPNERWSFAFGALATGRNDIPVIPAVGGIWTPSPHMRLELMMPKPRVAMLLKDDGARQHWGYFGAEMSGGRWAFQRLSGSDDELNYREWSVMLGWESTDRREPGSFRPPTNVRFGEVGLVFGREFEFERMGPDLSLPNALLLRIGFRQ